jgi:hypothetical protein
VEIISGSKRQTVRSGQSSMKDMSK